MTDIDHILVHTGVLLGGIEIKLEWWYVMKGENMRTKDEILKRIDELSNMVAHGVFTQIMEAHQTGIVSGLQWALEGEHRKPDYETEMIINIKFEVDKESYKQFKADMSEIEAEYKTKSNKVSYKDLYKQVVSDMDDMGIPEKQDDTTEHIPATLKDVCMWWIKTYPEHKLYPNGRYDLIRYQMVQILKDTECD